jgi:hypothetical protein
MRHRSLIGPGESAWGLGQIIAVILIISPVVEGLSLAAQKLNSKTKGKLEYWFHGCLTENEEPWPSFHDRMCKHIDLVVAKLHAYPDPQVRDAILHALASAMGFLHAANVTITRSPYDIPLPPSGPNSARISQIEMATVPPGGPQPGPQRRGQA